MRLKLFLFTALISLYSGHLAFACGFPIVIVDKHTGIANNLVPTNFQLAPNECLAANPGPAGSICNEQYLSLSDNHKKYREILWDSSKPFCPETDRTLLQAKYLYYRKASYLVAVFFITAFTLILVPIRLIKKLASKICFWREL